MFCDIKDCHNIASIVVILQDLMGSIKREIKINLCEKHEWLAPHIKLKKKEGGDHEHS